MKKMGKMGKKGLMRGGMGALFGKGAAGMPGAAQGALPSGFPGMGKGLPDNMPGGLSGFGKKK